MRSSEQNSVSGLDINSSFICLAQALSDNKIIANLSIQPLEIGIDGYWKSVIMGLSEFSRNLKLKDTNVISSIPGEYAVIKKILLEKDEISINETIEWELSQQIVGSIDDYIYDYQNISYENEGEYSGFLVVAYRSSVVSRLFKLLKSNKLNPVVIDLDIFALVNVYEMNYKERLSSPALIIYSDSIKTKLILTQGGNFVDIDIIEHNENTKKVENYFNILKETINKLFACNSEFSIRDNVHTYLTGSGFFQSGITDIILKSIPNSEMLNPFRKIKCSAGMNENELIKYSPQLGVAVGLALGEID